MNEKVQRYYQLKQQQKDIEQELTGLRQDITAQCAEQGITNAELGDYRVKIVIQHRKEYDDRKLYQALPDPQIWRMLSKPDASKITSLIKLNVISEESIKDTFTVKPITLLQIEHT